MEKEKRLEKASQHIFSMGLNDSGAKIGIKVMSYGLAKIHCLQEELGLKPNAFFLGSTDLTITRNVYRFNQGFGYGGVINWGTGKVKILPVDIKPNACGMLVGGIDEFISCTELIQSLEELKNDPGEIAGTNLKWDFNTSNHFINLFQVSDNDQLPPYIFVIHGAGDEFRGDHDNQFGLYIDKSKILYSKAYTLFTPFGPINYLLDEMVERYFEFYQAVEEFTKQRRLYVAHQLFKKFQLITDQCHQGLTSVNQMILGCHKFSDEKTIFPLMLRADRPGFLLTGKYNLTPNHLINLGFAKRAESLGLYDELCQANILPHGGGYFFPDILNVEKVREIGLNRYYELNTISGLGKKIVQHLREVPYEYRGQEVLDHTLQLDLGRVCATLIPLYSLKI